MCVLFNILHLRAFRSLPCLSVLSLMFLNACINHNDPGLLSGVPFVEPPGISAYVFINTACPVCLKYQGVFKQYATADPPVYFVFPGRQDSAAIGDYATYDSLQADRIVLDPAYRLCRRLKAEITPQVVLLSGGRIVYSGLLDNRFPDIGSERPAATVNYLNNALISLQKNGSVPIKYTRPVGCFIEPR